MTRLPVWLAQLIEDKTGLAPGGRYTRRRRCKRCGALTLTGLDNDWCALEVVVDPEPLDQAGEATAKFYGRQTYALRVRGGHGTLTWRDRWQTAAPHGPRTPTILAEHVCPPKEPDVRHAR